MTRQIFSVTVYWLVDFRSGGARWIYFFLILYLTEIFGASLITCVAALTPSSVYASTLVPTTLLLLILASGTYQITLLAVLTMNQVS